MSCERQKVPGANGCESWTGGDHEFEELERGVGQLENVELMSDVRRQDVVEKLECCCEMALSLVYSDQSTQLREIAAKVTVHCSFCK